MIIQVAYLFTVLTIMDIIDETKQKERKIFEMFKVNIL